MRISESIIRSPVQTVIIGFELFIFIGITLVMFPVASTHEHLGFVNDLFTSTSAVCVTGLTVVDKGSALNPFGQSILLILIQVGRLGIMTMSTLFLMLAGKGPALGG